MHFFRRLNKLIPVLSILSLLGISLTPVQAAMVNNEMLMSQSQHNITVQQVLTQLDRKDVQDKLISMGVDPIDAKSRVSQLSENELAQIRDNFEQMPAGSGIIGALLVVFVVLVVTDMLGATDVFTFVHDINH